MEQYDPGQAVVDYCRFGEPYRKRTSIFYWTPEPGNKEFLQPIAKRCPGNHEHVHLSGWNTKRKDNRATKSAAAYPGRLCNLWVNCVNDLVYDLRDAQENPTEV